MQKIENRMGIQNTEGEYGIRIMEYGIQNKGYRIRDTEFIFL
jgi:hypothetical protein